ncbi:MAG TPA: BamA/TamA family outer membrane protein [Vicinamibacterales bacterium]|nr:BamA/TamA family outer membrane protein [Vicinamibacterales bacterium]
MTRGRRLLRPVAALIFIAVAMAPIEAQEPETRAEIAQREREEKSRRLRPPEPGRAERVLLDLENGRLFERLLNPAQGLYPRIGNITSGSGFSVGPGYRWAGLFGGRADLNTFAAASFTRYWMIDARLQMPRLAGGRVGIDLHAQRYDFPKEDFFGLGPDSRRDDEVTYGLGNTVFGVTGVYRPTSWLNVGAAVDHLRPTIEAGIEPGEILSVFGPASAPGVLAPARFFKYEASVDVNTREPRGNPRRGGRYGVAYQRFEDTEGDRFSFNRVEADVQHYVPLLRDRRILALHGLVSIADADAGAEVPFYLQRTLGGPNDLRGFRYLRFRDRNALLLQAEYRWEIFTAVDGALFYDTGKVASRVEDLNLRDLESDYGIGFRFGSVNGVFLRVEGAFGSRAGAHFVLRFSNAF